MVVTSSGRTERDVSRSTIPEALKAQSDRETAQLRLLVLYHMPQRNNRRTIFDHIFCFGRYAKDCRVDYCNILLDIPWYVKWARYDAVILHYSLLVVRYEPAYWVRMRKRLLRIRELASIVVAIPQDEYDYNAELCAFFRDVGVTTVVTCADPCDYRTLYPEDRSGVQHFITTFPGLVDEKTLQRIEELKEEMPCRDIGLGYRGRKLQFWLGRHGQWKQKIGELFESQAITTDLKMDVSTNPEDTFLGDDWLRFLLRCRCVLGCLGGASLLSSAGEIREAVLEYLRYRPDASFDEVEEEVFPGCDYNISLMTLGPRHFEACMTKTCQVLLEGDYKGVLLPGAHYIELKQDFSNIQDVLAKIADTELCTRMAERAHEDVVASGKYTYRTFVEEILGHIRAMKDGVADSNGRSRQTLFLGNGVQFLLSIRQRLMGFHRILHNRSAST